MTSTSLENLTSYATPTQSQQPQTAGLVNEHEETPGQKRKRNTTELQVEQNVQPQQERQEPQSPALQPAPQNGPPSTTMLPPGRDLPTHEMPQFNRLNSQSLPTSPTCEAQKRRKLLNSGPNAQETNQRQEMEIDEEVAQEANQGEMPMMANRRGWYEETPGR